MLDDQSDSLLRGILACQHAACQKYRNVQLEVADKTGFFMPCGAPGKLKEEIRAYFRLCNSTRIGAIAFVISDQGRAPLTCRSVGVWKRPTTDRTDFGPIGCLFPEGVNLGCPRLNSGGVRMTGDGGMLGGQLWIRVASIP